MPDVAEIAGRLSEAQREVLCRPRDKAWTEREQAGFLDELFGPRWCGFAHLSPLGRAVRAYLENSRD